MEGGIESKNEEKCFTGEKFYMTFMLLLLLLFSLKDIDPISIFKTYMYISSSQRGEQLCFLSKYLTRVEDLRFISFSSFLKIIIKLFLAFFTKIYFCMMDFYMFCLLGKILLEKNDYVLASEKQVSL